MLLNAHEKLVAKRYLTARRSESFIGVIIWFAIIGIALGVMTLVVVTSVMNGVREEMLKHFIGLSGHVHVYETSGIIPDTNDLLKEINAMAQVKRAVPVIEEQVMVTASGVARGAQVKAYDLSSVEDVEYLDKYFSKGSVRSDGLAIGSGLSRSLRGQNRLTLISPDGRQTVVGLVPRMKAYPVLGQFTFGMQMIDNNLILMPYGKAQTYFKLPEGNSTQAIEITLHSIDDTASVANALRQKLGRNYRVLDWQQTNGAVFEALNVQRTVMFLILMMILLVAAFNIIASLVMLVKDKQRDIAVMRAYGVSRRSIQKVFVWMGVRIGALATLVGVVLGIFIALNADNIRGWLEQLTGQDLLGGNLYFLATLPAKIDWLEIGLVVVMALVLSFLATLYPARRAAALDPAEALRYE